MAFGKIIVFLISLLILFSCAQVGQLSGGKKDEIAPQPIVGKTIPPNGSKNFQGKSIEITFDEYIQLNNPQQTLVIVPNHAKLKASIHKKTLTIKWDESLEENTTYVISLNGTIKDVTENNDTLINYVFSTGNSLDSLRYSVNVIDAWNNKPVANATVGLFIHKDSLNPYYFTRTDRNGKANFLYIKPGKYFVRAFLDDNKDLRIQKTESIAFRSEVLKLDSSIIDTIPLRLFKPLEKQKIRSFTYAAPGKFIIGTNYSIKNAAFYINSSPIDSTSYRIVSEDSVQLFTPVKDLSEIQVRIKSADKIDSISMRLTEKEKQAKIQLKPNFKNLQLAPHETFSFQVNDLITYVDPSKIKITDPKDSSASILFKSSFYQNQLTLEFDRKNYKDIFIAFEKGTIETINNSPVDSSSLSVKLLSIKDFGSINVDVSAYKVPIIIELIKGSKVIESIFIKSPSKHVFKNLYPDEYQFRIIEDLNENQHWDTGNLELDKQAESVNWFSTPVKVRANWDMDILLSPEK